MERLEEERKVEVEEEENGTKEKRVRGEREWLSGCDERIMRQIRPVSSCPQTAQHRVAKCHRAASMTEQEDRKQRWKKLTSRKMGGV